MTYREVLPTDTKSESHGGIEVTTEHPAFGTVTLSRVSGRTRLFGSELQHSETMKVTVHRAKQYRTLSYDRTYGNEVQCEFYLSLAQWASFVGSAGMGAGVPCTLRYHRDGSLVDVPGIAAPETGHVDKFRDEMREMLDTRTAAVRESLATLSDVLEKGGGKVAMREALKTALRHAEQLPGSVDFINRQFAESVEHIVSDAKVEVEGFVSGLAMRTGIKALQDAAPQISGLLNDPDHR